jgi:hypothetical protein
MTLRPPQHDRQFATSEEWQEITGMKRSHTYDCLARGDLRAKKVGRRLFIDVKHGLRFMRSQPDAKITLARINAA